MTTRTTADDLAHAFESGLALASDEDRRTARAVARLLAAEASPLEAARVVEAVAARGWDAEARIAELPWVVRDESDRLTGLWGLTVIETPHRLRIAGRDLFAFCALDALYLPFLLDETIGVESTCPTTGERISLSVSTDGISNLSPVQAAVSVRAPAEGFTRKAGQMIEDACHYVHFFATEEGAREWTAERAGSVLSVADAFELAATVHVPALVPNDR